MVFCYVVLFPLTGVVAVLLPPPAIVVVVAAVFSVELEFTVVVVPPEKLPLKTREKFNNFRTKIQFSLLCNSIKCDFCSGCF